MVVVIFSFGLVIISHSILIRLMFVVHVVIVSVWIMACSVWLAWTGISLGVSPVVVFSYKDYLLLLQLVN